MSDRFLERRSQLSQVIGLSGLAIITASSEVIRNYDVPHPFRQDSAFWFMTGFHEPDAVAVLAPGHDDGDYILFVRPKDPTMEVWTGIRTGADGAKKSFGADVAYELSELDDVLERMMVGREVLWYTTGNEAFDDKVAAIVTSARNHRERSGGAFPSTVSDLSVPIGEMMLFKSGSEAESLRQACLLTADGHREAMRFARPGMYEYEIQAAMEYGWRSSGSRRNGYGSIVASGSNACVLHYEENNSQVGSDDLVLIDAAAEIDGYSSDITRTFPANGKFTGPQRGIYDVVLAAQQKGIELSVPGGSMKTIHDEATRVLTEGMVDLGLLPGSAQDALSMHHYSDFYMHGTGHWLGLDVHDRGSYKVDGVSRPLAEGMAFTVEPGLYVAADKSEIELTLLAYDLDERNERRIRIGKKAASVLEEEELEGAEKVTHAVPEEFLGIGVRIEDDILITVDGHENMTSSVPVEVDQIEALCAETSVMPSL